MLFSLWSVRALAFPVDCDQPTPPGAVHAALSRAEAAIDALDADALDEATRTARLAVICVEEPLDRSQWARLFRLDGVARFVGDDWVSAVSRFEAARALDADATLPENLGAPLRRVWDAVPPPTGATMVLPAPSEGWIEVDGVRADRAPADRVYALQWMRADGSVHGTWIVAEGAIPAYPRAPAPGRRGVGRADHR